MFEKEKPDAIERTGTDAVSKADQSTLTAMTREAVEAKGMVEAAKAFPRNEMQAFAALDRAVCRPGLAEKAVYRFPRGGQDVSGPTVVLAREAARCWGNIIHALKIVQETDDRVHLQGVAHDLETNTRAVHEDKFAKLIQRKNKRTGETLWVQPDERDLRELINRRGALLVRNAILEVLPRDLIEDAVERSYQTMREDSMDRLKKGRKDATKEVVRAFERFHVDVAMLEEFLGHGLDTMDADELSTLRGIYTSLRDGNTKRADHFGKTEDKVSTKKAADLSEELLSEDEPEEDDDVSKEAGVTMKACPACGGSGGTADAVCADCAGSGEVPA